MILLQSLADNLISIIPDDICSNGIHNNLRNARLACDRLKWTLSQSDTEKIKFFRLYVVKETA